MAVAYARLMPTADRDTSGEDQASDPHRLPRAVAPTRYELLLRPDLDAATFSGTATIELDVAEATDTLVMNAHELTIDRISLTTAEPGITSSVAAWSLDEDLQRLTVTLTAPIGPGAIRLTIDFTGILNDQLVGFYRSTYTDDAGEHVLACTQFEAPHARQAFPCWDEPDRKASFAVTLEVRSELLAVSNGLETSRTSIGDGWDRVTFAETMIMSTYLVAFVIGRLEATEPIDVRGTPIRVIARPGTLHLTALAIDVARHSLEWFEDYYGIAYPGDSLDLVAVPDFAFGAMENLGCVTFREILLLADPDTITAAEQTRAALVIAHEIAHMWFGDLVTMNWWTGIWLNEAFATFMELACVDAYRPQWKVWSDFGLSRTEAFEIDALSATRAIEFEVQTPADAEGMFDVLTYEKGCAVLRMMEQYIGSEVFRDGVRAYLTRHAYGNTVTSDLWDALEEVSGQPIRRVMDSWILQGGHPVLTATTTDTGVRLSQQRMAFVGGPSTRPLTWSVPVVARIDGTESRLLLDGESVTVPVVGGSPEVCANVGAVGFYRVALDAPLRDRWAAGIATADPMEQYAFLDDTWALLLADRATIQDVVAAVLATADSPDVAVLRRVATVMNALDRLCAGVDTDAVAALARRIGTAIRSDPDPERAAVGVRLAGVIGGDPEVIAQARLDAADGTGVHPELLAAAIDVVATHGDHDTFDVFVSRFLDAATPQDERRYLNALTRFGDPTAFAALLELCRTTIRTQDAPYQLSLAMGNRSRGAEAWEFVRDHWDELNERFPRNSIIRMVSGIRSFWDPALCDDILGFFETHEIPQGAVTLAQQLELVAVHRAVRIRTLGCLTPP